MTTNRHPAPCARCGKTVQPGEGLISGGKSRTEDWRVVHDTCIPGARETPAPGAVVTP